jgi:DNA-binding NtrC family response regulator
MVTDASREEARTRGHILVVDDEEDIREALGMILSMEGYDVSTASCGDAAVTQAEEVHFDLVITDLKMPGMDGVETLMTLRRRHPGLQVIVATGYASSETARRCLSEGAHDYITKPFDMDDLLRLVQQAIAAGRAHLGGAPAET